MYALLHNQDHHHSPPLSTYHPTERKLKPANKIICALCNHSITSSHERIAMDASHEHTFFNPHGIIFHLGCFRRAPGCLTSGIPSLEFSWFKGYAWILVYCGQCHRHLGWMFLNNEQDSFFALILNRLREANEANGQP